MSDLDRIAQLERAIREAQMFLNSMPATPSVDSYINEGVVGARKALNDVVPIQPPTHNYQSLGAE